MRLASLSAVAESGIFDNPPNPATLRRWCEQDDNPIGVAAQKIRNRWYVDLDKIDVSNHELLEKLTG